MFRFTIRDVLLVMVIVGLATGWWMEHRHLGTLRSRCDRLEALARATTVILSELGVDADFTNDNIEIGGSHFSPVIAEKRRLRRGLMLGEINQSPFPSRVLAAP